VLLARELDGVRTLRDIKSIEVFDEAEVCTELQQQKALVHIGHNVPHEP